MYALYNATIFYTTDGREPDSDSPVYTGPLTINSVLEPTVLKAVAMKSGWTNSETVTAKYYILPYVHVSAPVINLQSGLYDNDISIEISCATPEATIRYTCDGSNPDLTSDIYISALELSSHSIIKAAAYKPGMIKSDIAMAEYSFQAAQPVILPAAGAYMQTQMISISCLTSNSDIRYTFDNTEPDINSNLYTGSLELTSSAIVKAKAFRSGFNASKTVSKEYILPGEFVYIPPGTFNMGRATGSGMSGETPVHSVSLSGYNMGKYEVTQETWQAVMGNNPSMFTGSYKKPVERVSWYAAMVFCNKLSVLLGMTPVYSISGSTDTDVWGPIPTVNTQSWNGAYCYWANNGFRLPSEAEWEYAARGAANTPDYLYSGSNTIDDVAWYNLNSEGKSHEIGLKIPNGIGIYDLTGNVWEWCWDWYNESYYLSSPVNNPTGPGIGNWRVLRGGSWSYQAYYCRNAMRYMASPYYNNAANLGLRLSYRDN